jgi:hypothetical protein
MKQEFALVGRMHKHNKSVIQVNPNFPYFFFFGFLVYFFNDVELLTKSICWLHSPLFSKFCFVLFFLSDFN